MNPTNYPIVTTESRTIGDTEYWYVNARIINLQTCKIVTLQFTRKSNLNFSTTQWQTVWENLATDLRPNLYAYSTDSRQQINFRITNAGLIEARPSTTGQKTFETTFTYVII